MTRSPTCAPARHISARASALAALRAPRLRPTRPALGPLRPGELAVPDTVVFRGAVPDEDVVTIAGVRLLSPARAAVDLARTAAPARAVEALLTARCLGVGNQELHLALTHCLGSACRGRPRARRLIDALVPREPRPVQVPGAAPAQP